MVNIVSFSGGKDSTTMLLKLVENGEKIDEIIFADTGLEYPEIYRHVDKVEKYINIPITRVKSEYSYEYYMFEYVVKDGKHKGEKGWGWSNYHYICS